MKRPLTGEVNQSLMILFNPVEKIILHCPPFLMSLKPVSRFWSMLRPFRLQLRQIYFYAIMIGLVNLSLPLGIQAIINFLQSGDISAGWVVLVGFVLAGIAITGLLQILQMRVVENIQQHLFVDSAFDFAYRVPRIQLAELDDVHAPELVNRFFDTLTIQKGLPKILIDFSLSAFQVIFGLILLAIYSPFFILLGLLFFFIIWLIYTVTGPQGMKTSLKESTEKYRLAHWLEEMARTQKSFKLRTAAGLHLRRTDEIASAYLASRESHFQVLVRQAQYFIGFKIIVAAALLVLGGVLVFQEQMNLGQFVAAEIIIILIINSLEKIIRVFETIFDVLTALEKMGFVTDLRLDETEGVLLNASTSGLSIRAEGLYFGYPDQPMPILRDLTFDIRSGDKVVVEGESGTGKTTLLRVLGGLYEHSRGDLTIQQLPISRYNKEELFNQIGYYYPSKQLFEGTFLENIAMDRPVDPAELEILLRVVGLAEYLDLQPQGIHTQIDPDGRRLPRSIMQRALIARAMAGKPRLLLLEDPLLSFKPEERQRVIDFIMDPAKPWTVIVVPESAGWTEKATSIIRLAPSFHAKERRS